MKAWMPTVPVCFKAGVTVCYCNLNKKSVNESSLSDNPVVTLILRMYPGPPRVTWDPSHLWQFANISVLCLEVCNTYGADWCLKKQKRYWFKDFPVGVSSALFYFFSQLEGEALKFCSVMLVKVGNCIIMSLSCFNFVCFTWKCTYCSGTDVWFERIILIFFCFF